MAMKEAYYFSHDSNARQDEKILALRMRLGWEGYGLYWAIVEKLREASSYCLNKDYNLIAYDLRSDSSKIKSIVEEFGLFSFTDDGECFYSERLKRNMDKKSEKARAAANARWKGVSDSAKSGKPPDKDASAMHAHSNRNANAMLKDAIKVKESKVKKSKVKESKEREIRTRVGDEEIEFYDSKNQKKDNPPPIAAPPPSLPSLHEFTKYALSRFPDADEDYIRGKYHAWVENDWHTGRGKKIKNWKTTICNTIPYGPKKKTSNLKTLKTHRDGF